MEEAIMSSFTNPLDSIKVASPCSADWEAMIGNERKRYCGQCKLNVYNLSGMTRKEAEGLLMNSEGRVCARFFRREDGTILTKDCPVGWAAAKQKMSRVWTAVASMAFTLVSGIGIVSIVRSAQEPTAVMGAIPIERPLEQPALMGAVAIEPTIGEPAMGKPVMEMGDVAMPHDEPKMGEVDLVRE
jgi:hypothetical protein